MRLLSWFGANKHRPFLHVLREEERLVSPLQKEDCFDYRSTVLQGKLEMARKRWIIEESFSLGTKARRMKISGIDQLHSSTCVYNHPAVKALPQQ